MKKIRLRLLVFSAIRLHPKTADSLPLRHPGNTSESWKDTITQQTHTSKGGGQAFKVSKLLLGFASGRPNVLNITVASARFSFKLLNAQQVLLSVKRMGVDNDENPRDRIPQILSSAILTKLS